MSATYPYFYRALPNEPDTSVLVDGRAIPACSGDTLLSVLLQSGMEIGSSEFDGQKRAGFCLMGACQDCTIWSVTGARARACMIEVQPGMAFRRSAPLEEPGR